MYMKKKTLQFTSAELENEYFTGNLKNLIFQFNVCLFITGFEALIYIIYAVIYVKITITLILFCSLFAVSFFIKLILWFKESIFNWLIFVRNIFMLTMLFILYKYTDIPFNFQQESEIEEQLDNLTHQDSFLFGVTLVLEHLLNVHGTNLLLKVVQHIFHMVLYLVIFTQNSLISNTDSSTCQSSLSQFTNSSASSTSTTNNQDISSQKNITNNVSNSSEISPFIFTIIPQICVYIYMEYHNENISRLNFLTHRKEKEQRFVIDKLMPLSIITTKYEKKERRVMLHHVNRKANKQFNIKDDESLKEFCKKLKLKPCTNQRLRVEDEQKSQFQINTSTQLTLFYYLESAAQNFLQRHGMIRQKSDQPPQNAVSGCIGGVINESNNQINIQKKKTISVKTKSNTLHAKPADEHLTFDEKSIRAQSQYRGGGSLAVDSYQREKFQKQKSIKRRISGFDLKNTMTNKRYNSDVLERLEIFEGEYKLDDFAPKQKFDVKVFMYAAPEIYLLVLIEDETLKQKLTNTNKYLEKYTQMISQLIANISESTFNCIDFLDQILQNDHSLIKSMTTINSSSSKVQFSNCFNNNNNINISCSNVPNLVPQSSKKLSHKDSFNQQCSIQEHFERLSSSLQPQQAQGQQPLQIKQIASRARYQCFQSLILMYNYKDFQNFTNYTFTTQLQEISLSRILQDIKEIVQGEMIRRNLELIIINELIQDGIIENMSIRKNQQFQQESMISLNSIPILDPNKPPDLLITDERLLKTVILNILFQCISQVRQGYIALRVKDCKNMKNTLKFQIIDSGEQSVGLNDEDDNLRFNKQNIDDIINIIHSGRDQFSLQISQKIVGKLGPYQKIKSPQLKGGQSQKQGGTNITFKVYRDLQLVESIINNNPAPSQLKIDSIQYQVPHSEDLSDESDQEIHQIVFKLNLKDDHPSFEKPQPIVSIEDYQLDSNNEIISFPNCNDVLKVNKGKTYFTQELPSEPGTMTVFTKVI